MRARDLRFNDETRIELRSGATVRPLDDRFTFRPSGDAGPAGIFVLCSLGFEEPDPCPAPGEDADKVDAVREIYLSRIVAIRGALDAEGRAL